MIIYHTSLGSKPLRRVFHFDNQPTKLVSNIHVTLLIGYDDDYYYYIDPLWSRLSNLLFSIYYSNSKQIIKIKKHTLENSYNAPGKNAYISIINNKASRDCLNSVSRGFIK